MTAPQTAIPADNIGDMDLTQITAAEFVKALDQEGLGAQALKVIPEKKKVELWQEPEWNRPPRVVDFIRRIRNEKKKYELEVNWDQFGWQYGDAAHAARGSNAGRYGYPHPDGPDDGFPPEIEHRKVNLDTRIERVASMVIREAMADLELRLSRKIDSIGRG